jgi:hypothetical protein
VQVVVLRRCVPLDLPGAVLRAPVSRSRRQLRFHRRPLLQRRQQL